MVDAVFLIPISVMVALFLTSVATAFTYETTGRGFIDTLISTNWPHALFLIFFAIASCVQIINIHRSWKTWKRFFRDFSEFIQNYPGGIQSLVRSSAEDRAKVCEHMLTELSQKVLIAEDMFGIVSDEANADRLKLKRVNNSYALFGTTDGDLTLNYAAARQKFAETVH